MTIGAIFVLEQSLASDSITLRSEVKRRIEIREEIRCIGGCERRDWPLYCGELGPHSRAVIPHRGGKQCRCSGMAGELREIGTAGSTPPMQRVAVQATIGVKDSFTAHDAAG